MYLIVSRNAYIHVQVRPHIQSLVHVQPPVCRFWTITDRSQFSPSMWDLRIALTPVVNGHPRSSGVIFSFRHFLAPIQFIQVKMV